MTIHYWGDDWPHWNELYEAGNYIHNFVYKYSRCRLVYKEKYGTLRYEWMLPPPHSCFSRWEITVPFIRYNTELIKQENNKLLFKRHYNFNGKCKLVLWRWHDSWLYSQWAKLGRRMLRRAVLSACKKFTNVRREIYTDYHRTKDCII